MPTDADTSTELGVLLRAKRTAKGLSQSALAEVCGFKQHTISEWENGVRPPSLMSAIKLSEALEVSVDDLAAAIKRDDPDVT